MTIAEMNGEAPARILALIQERGLKKMAVAERAHITAQDLSGILAGRRLLKISELVAFAAALGVEPNDLVMPTDQAGAK